MLKKKLPALTAFLFVCYLAWIAYAYFSKVPVVIENLWQWYTALNQLWQIMILITFWIGFAFVLACIWEKRENYFYSEK